MKTSTNKTTTSIIGYKFLKNGNLAPYAYDFQYKDEYLPHQDENGKWVPGAWMPDVRGRLIMCDNGYHFCDMVSVNHWTSDIMYVVESSGVVIADGKKMCAKSIRFLRKVDGYNRTSLAAFAAYLLRLAWKAYNTKDVALENLIKSFEHYATNPEENNNLRLSIRGDANAIVNSLICLRERSNELTYDGIDTLRRIRMANIIYDAANLRPFSSTTLIAAVINFVAGTENDRELAYQIACKLFELIGEPVPPALPFVSPAELDDDNEVEGEAYDD